MTLLRAASTHENDVMPLGPLLWTSLLIFGVVGVVVLLAPALRTSLSRRSVTAAVALAAILSAGSSLVSESGASGTGTRTSHGFPKPYYFTWQSWEQSSSSAGVNWLYFAGNCIAWLAVVSLALVIWTAVRQRFAISLRR